MHFTPSNLVQVYDCDLTPFFRFARCVSIARVLILRHHSRSVMRIGPQIFEFQLELLKLFNA